MDIKDFRAGKYKKGYEYTYFLPEKINSTYTWADAKINELLEQAALKIGELNSFSRFVPDVNMFIKLLVFKEAVVSSRIEGTRTNIEDALTDEKEIAPEKRDDWKEVNNYVLAMNEAILALKILPLSNRLMKDAHKVLLASTRGQYKTPGEFRKSQNWIGGATLADAVFIPPAHDELPELLTDLEKFLHNREIQLPHLIKIAIAHYQFETIHPFLDGNGRIGRLLITLYLVANHIMDQPLLYLSEFFERNKSLYYDNLTCVRTKDDLSQWIRFFLVGIIETAGRSITTLKNILHLKSSIENEHIIAIGKRSKTAMQLLHGLFAHPVISVKDAQEITGLSAKAANDLIKIFVSKNILIEMTGYQRNRIFAFHEYLAVFERKSG